MPLPFNMPLHGILVFLLLKIKFVKHASCRAKKSNKCLQSGNHLNILKVAKVIPLA